MKESTSPMKKVAANCTVTMLWYQCLTYKREEHIGMLIEELALNKKFIH
jgi:hypothetical protein